MALAFKRILLKLSGEALAGDKGFGIETQRIHSIAAEDFMQKLGVNSKMNADWEFLTHLRDAGRARKFRYRGWSPGNLAAPRSSGSRS